MWECPLSEHKCRGGMTMVDLNQADKNDIAVIVDDLRELGDQATTIGIVGDGDGGVRNYLDDTEEGRRLASQLETVQTMCNEAADALSQKVQELSTD